MIHILLSQPDSYRDITEHLVSAGAQVTLVGPAQSGNNIRSKKTILKAMVSPALLRARKRWDSSDRVLVIGWQALPILAMIKLGLLRRPAKLLVMACFIHGKRARSIVNRVWRMLRMPELGFITFSQGEARNLIQEVGIPPEYVHFHLWRQALDGQVPASSIIDDGSIFSGGFSNRDYDLLLDAAQELHAPLTIVASSGNLISSPIGTQTTIHRDLDETHFETLLARSCVVAMPLKSQGEACGQSVLLRVLRNGKPLIATRHEAIEAYLGKEYQGFVPHGDVEAMRASLERALIDNTFRATLISQIDMAYKRLEQHGGPGAEIARFLLA